MLTRSETRTGGRQATTRHIPPKLALAVGMPTTPAPKSWRWVPLTSIARMESGHTPSRRHSEYWSGEIPWISLADAKLHHGGTIDETIETTNELGIENSSARVLPAGTVCLSRTASVGYTLVMGRPMATSQDFVNWICSKELDPEFLQYLFLSEGEDLLRFASGAVHSTIYFPEAKAFHVCIPDVAEQHRIVRILDEAFEGIASARANTEKNLANARAVFEGHRAGLFQNRDGGWTETTIDKLSENLDSKRIPITKSVRKSGTYPYYGASGVVDQVAEYIFEGDALLVSEDGANLLARSTPIAFSVTGKYWVNNHAHILKFDSITTQRFVEFYLESIRLDEYVTGAAQPKLNQKALNSIPIPIPRQLQEQATIVASIEALSVEVQRLEGVCEQKITALDALKQSLLREAFSGRL